MPQKSSLAQHCLGNSVCPCLKSPCTNTEELDASGGGIRKRLGARDFLIGESGAHSGVIRSLIPIESDHLFRRNPTTDSDSK